MKITETVGKDGRMYYFKDGTRISKVEALSLLKRTKKSKIVKNSGKDCEPPCEDYKICNPNTRRCVLRRGQIGRKLLHGNYIIPRKRSKGSKIKRKVSKKFKPCKPHQYRNKTTNRCVNKPGYKRDRKSKKCKSHQYRNKITNRCVNRSGYKRGGTKIVKQRYSYIKKSKWDDKNISKKDTRNCIARSKITLRPHQERIVRYMQKHRSLLVIHGTGTGKTLTAVTAAQCYLDENPRNKVYFVGPTSLVSNFKKELRKYGLKGSEINENFRFFSFDKFLIETKKILANIDVDKKLFNWPKKTINLQNCMLIVDESHNMRNPKSLKSKALVAASFKASKVVLLTATPFVNNIIDFVPLINMLWGYKIVGTKKEFNKGLVSDYLVKDPSEDNLMVFAALLKHRVDVFTKRDAKDFPARKNHTELVEMTKDYYERYTKLMSSQRVSGLFFYNPAKFYHGYRRAVNKAGPQYYSMKVRKAVPILKKGKSLIYSNWREFGVTPITRVLEKNNISYRVFTGSTKISERQKIVNQFNKNEFQVLIITKAGGEGLDLTAVRSVVVLDPTWNDAGLQQIIGRAIRFKSHHSLPKSQRVVSVYFMALIPPANIDQNQPHIPSGDQLLYSIIREKVKLEVLLTKILRKNSI